MQGRFANHLYLCAIHYNFGTLTNFLLPVKLKGIDFKCHFC